MTKPGTACIQNDVYPICTGMDRKYRGIFTERTSVMQVTQTSGITPVCSCGNQAVMFSHNRWYCLKHLSKAKDSSDDDNEPVEHHRYATATDMLQLLNRVERLEQIVEEWSAGQ